MAAFSTASVNKLTFGCFSKITSEPWWAARIAAYSMLSWLALALGATYVVRGYIAATEPKPPILVKWPDGKFYNLEKRSFGGYWLRLHFQVDPAALCTRQAIHLMYLDRAGQPREYYTVSSSLNGPDMPDRTFNFIDLYELPIDFQSGDWEYEYRAQYMCPPFDLIHHTQVTTPIKIRVPELDKEPKPN